MASAIDKKTIAELYAGALLELAQAENATEALDQEFAEFAAYLKIESDFRTFFQSRIIDSATRGESLDRLLRGKMSDLLLQALQILNRRGRNDVVLEMQLIYHKKFIETQGIIEADVTSAHSLSDASRARVIEMLEKHTGNKINLIEHVDPAVIGGLIVNVGDSQVDASVSRQLRSFHHTLLEQASRSIHAGTEKFFEGLSEV